MKKLTYLDEYRIDGYLGDEYNGAFRLKLNGSNLDFVVIASNGGGWEHISVSTEVRCPRWGEMCQIKDLFFNKNEIAIQYHPAESEYVNNHEYCLHMWRPLEATMPIPDSILVGIKGIKLPM